MPIFFLILFSLLSTLSVQAESHPFWNESFIKCSPLPEVGCKGLFPIRGLNETRVAILENGDDSFAARVKSIQQAKESIYIESFIFTGDESGYFIAELLKAKKKQGVDVKIIVDAMANFYTNIPTTMRLYRDLAKNGIVVEGSEFHTELIFKDPAIVSNRFHDKVWVVDGNTKHGVAIVGGLNVANEYFRVGPEREKIWRDQDIIVVGNTVQDMQKKFLRNYDYYQQLKKNRPALFETSIIAGTLSWISNASSYFTERFNSSTMSHVEEMSKKDLDLHWYPVKSLFLQSRPIYKETYINDAYLALFRSAQKEILISNSYIVPTKETIQEITNAALRGVNITILTNSLESNDVPFVSNLSRYYYFDFLKVNQQLKQLGMTNTVSLYEWQGHLHQESVNHSKFAVIDRQLSVVGSYNLYPRSLLKDSETVLIYESEPLAEELATIFFQNDLPKAKEISFEQAIKWHEATVLEAPLSRKLLSAENY